MITALLALGALGSTVAYSVAAGGRLAPVSLGVGGIGLGLLATATRLPLADAPALGDLRHRGRPTSPVGPGKDVVDGWAAVVGVLLLLAAELATWSIEHDTRIFTERSLTVRRVSTLTLLAGAALLTNFLLLGTAAISASSSVLLAAAGVAAAVGALVVVLRLTRG